MSSRIWLLLFLLFFAFLLRVDFIVYILYVLVGIILWSRWRTARVLKSVTVSRTSKLRSFLGESSKVVITLKNESRLPLPWLEVYESVPPELRLSDTVQEVVHMRGRSQLDISYQVRAQRRGLYRLGPLRLTSGDLFGLSDTASRLIPTDNLVVYPRIVRLVELGLPSRQPFGTVSGPQPLFKDPARPLNVRPFQSGDSPRQINWKATARQRQMLVRTLEPAISMDSQILLNLNASDYERRGRVEYTEWAIVVAASLASHLVARRQTVGISINGIDPLVQQEVGRSYDEQSGRMHIDVAEASEGLQRFTPMPIAAAGGRQHLMKVLEQLARIESAGTLPFANWVERAGRGLSWGVTLFVITAAATPTVDSAMHRFARQGFNPVLLIMEPDLEFSAVRRRGRLLGYEAFNINRHADLDRWRTRAARPSEKLLST